MAEKRYYWLKLQEDFFRQPAIKKLRRMAGGETFTIIYLKMQLLSLKQDGKLLFEHYEDDFPGELALTMEEEVDDVAATVNFLMRHGLLEVVETDSYIMPEVLENIGSQSASAKRTRKWREKMEKTSQCDGTKKIPSHCDGIECEKEGKTSHCDVEERREEKRREEKSRGEGGTAPPSLQEIRAYCKANNLRVDADHFFRHFEAGNWVDSKGRKVTNWRQKILEWEKYEGDGRQHKPKSLPESDCDDFAEADKNQVNPWEQ